MTRQEADKDVHIHLTLFRVAEKEYEGRVQRGDVYRFIAKITRPTKDTTHE